MKTYKLIRDPPYEQCKRTESSLPVFLPDRNDLPKYSIEPKARVAANKKKKNDNDFHILMLNMDAVVMEAQLEHSRHLKEWQKNSASFFV
jgi:hypothetical protein